MNTFGSLFSGIGGFDLGFERAGMRCLWQCEIDAAARSILRRHFPSATLYSDVTKLSRPAAVDVLCGGFPCQDLSVAGRRAGLAGSRSGLWHEFRRIVGEITPRVVVIENVPGLLSSEGGRDFGVLLQGLGELGYRIAWRVLDSQYDRVAQRRRRVFVVGSLGDGRCAEILFESESLRWDLAPGREAGQKPAPTLDCGSVSGGRKYGTDADSCESLVVAGTLQASGKAAGSATQQDAESGLLISLARCVTAGEGNRRDYETTTLVTAPLTTRPYADNESKESLLTVGTMRCNGDAHSGFEHGEGLIAYGISSDAIDRSGEGDGSAGQRAGLGIVENASPCLRSKGPNAVAGVMGVRRLTPKECERLQAFPDDWTRYTDTGREQKDGPRYKQLGNAVTVNVAEWIGRRITGATTP